MIASDLTTEISNLASRLADSKNWFPPVCKGAVKCLVKFLEQHCEEVADSSGFTLSSEQLSALHSEIFKSRSYQSLLRAQYINEILYALKLRDLYEGNFLNIPQQITRQLIMDLSEVPFEQFGIAEHIEKIIRNPEVLPAGASINEKELHYLCSFVVSAILDGALSEHFLKRLFMLRFSDITFKPLTIKIYHSEQGATESESKLSFIRYWFSPLTEMYFLRLLLFLRKNHRKLKLKFKGDNVFPESYLNSDRKQGIEKAFEKWGRKHAKVD